MSPSSFVVLRQALLWFAELVVLGGLVVCCVELVVCRPKDAGEALLYGGESGGGVVLIVHDRVHCWARGLSSMWWRLKEVGKAWRDWQASLIAWLLSGPLVSFVTRAHHSCASPVCS